MSFTKQIEDAAAEYIGQPLASFEAAAVKAGWTVRVMQDGPKHNIGTCDFRPNRINVAIANGLLTKLISVG